MHELAIARDLFALIKAKAKENNLERVTRIVIKLGALSGIEEDLLRHSLIEHIFPRTLCRDAELEFVKEPIELKCKKCGIINIPSGFDAHCPHCGSSEFDLTKGKDVYIENIEGEIRD